MKTIFLLGCLSLLLFQSPVEAQDASTPPPQKAVTATERDIKQFYDSYAEDLRQHRREGIANRYDERGYFSLGNGTKQFISFADNKKRYTTQWTGPKNFEWKDLSFEVLSPSAAAVTGLFDWTGASGEKDTLSYTAVLTKQSGQWRIRIEDESVNPTGFSTKTISGDRLTPGPYKYTLTAKPGASVSAHRHTTEMRVTIKTGSLFILMGDLETAKVQRFDAGSKLVIPANTWHVEWWENEMTAEIETIAPTRTERATPSIPRVL
ncbi:MAG TPA: DUF4440 domain-containing protein [Pyrinomonadaceae bacterium]|nr:DUF4440 domain-containing protein [Pyrinomonadaceae bacterium]